MRSRVAIHIYHLFTGTKGNSEFLEPREPVVRRGEAECFVNAVNKWSTNVLMLNGCLVTKAID